ncbi:aminoglycoside phosphotransferase family protein [Gordonia soli]|nr:aminoglycoside phosphotransferase family protein [Gordonia soli]
MFPAWLGRLTEIVGEHADLWELEVGDPFEPGGEAAWVGAARTADGRDAVLKIAPRLPENRDEAIGLELLATIGAAAVLHSRATGAPVTEHDGPDAGTIALLIERVHPGTPLAQRLPEIEQDVVVAELLAGIWTTPVGDADLRHLSELTALWTVDFEREAAAVAEHLDPALASRGVEMFRTLADTADDKVLLVTDLHAENILDGSDRWRLIDPKPYVGDRCYDVLQHLLNCRRFDHDPIALVDRMAALTGVDRDRLRAWAFARCVIESVWDTDRVHAARVLSGVV